MESNNNNKRSRSPSTASSSSRSPSSSSPKRTKRANTSASAGPKPRKTQKANSGKPAPEPKPLRLENNFMSIMKTGVRSGETITGISAASKNITMQVFFPEGQVFRPVSGYVDAMTDEDFRDGLNNVEFFADKSKEERMTWIRRHAQPDPNIYLSDMPGVQVRLLSVGGSMVDDDDPNLYDEFMDGELHDLQKIYKTIPGGEKTRSADEDSTKKHTLIFRGSIWKVKPRVVYATPDICIDLIGGELHHRCREEGNGGARRKYPCLVDRLSPNHANKATGPSVAEDHPIVMEINDNSTSPPFKRERWPQLFRYQESLAGAESYFDVIERQIKWFTPGLQKSLLQKLIRSRCSVVRLFNGVDVPAEAVLFVSFVLLVTDGGSFVPDMQRFVRGSESAFKRVGVAMGEDAFSTPEYINSMLAAAMVAQNYFEFVPSEELVAYAIVGAIASQRDHRAWDYEPKLSPTNMPSEEKWKYPFFLLHTLGSFSTDIGLLQYIGCHPKKLVSTIEQNRETTDPVMNIEYCLDQHTYTQIAHFFAPQIDTKPASFTPLFQYLFNKGTGRNARKTNMMRPGLPADIRMAQRLFWLSRTATRSEFAVTDQTKTISVQLDYSWLAGLLEKIEVRVPKSANHPAMNVHVFLHPDIEGKFIAIQPASRDKAAEDLSEDIKDEAIELAKDMLEKEGKRVRNALLDMEGKVTLKKYRDPDTQVDDHELYVDNERWADLRKSKKIDVATFIIPITAEWNPMDSALFHQICEVVFTHKTSHRGMLATNATPKIKELIANTPPDCLARICMYIRPLRSVIEIYRLSRDGSSTYLQTSWKDTVVFRFLMMLSLVAPGVIYPDKSLKFNILDYRVWSAIRKTILKAGNAAAAAASSSSSSSAYWSGVRFADPRTLFSHQVPAVEQLKQRVEVGRRGNLIWIPVGLGKTLIVTSFVGWLLQTKRMPPYCVYSLPPSAMDSIQKELTTGKLPYHVVAYTSKNKGQQLFRRHCINLIEHDNMRVAAEHMLSIAPDCFFILDEFHLAMNDTKRTSTALEMAKLAWNFVGMTGTLIKDKESKGVIEWVSQVVEFEVTPKNYWVAIASLVSRKIALKIPQERHFHEVEMTRDEKARFFSHMDRRFGGTASSTDFAKAAKECYAVIERGLFEIVAEMASPSHPRPIFVVAKDNGAQERLASQLRQVVKEGQPLRVFTITSKTPITLKPEDPKEFDVVITTCTHSTGYTLTQADTMITAVYFSNQATRDQLDGRILRLGQTATRVHVHILHTGILSYTLRHYEDARSLRQSLEGLAENVRPEDLSKVA